MNTLFIRALTTAIEFVAFLLLAGDVLITVMYWRNVPYGQDYMYCVIVVGAAVGLLPTIFLCAVSQLIHVFLRIEENTRKVA